MSARALRDPAPGVDPGRPPQAVLLSALLIFALALAVRLFFLAGIDAYPRFERIRNRLDDQVVFDLWARSLAAGRRFDYAATGHELGYWTPKYPGVYPQAPLYPFFVAAFYKLFGFRYDLVRGVQMVLGAAGSVLLYLLARRFLRPRTAILCGLAGALYGPFVFYEATLLRAPLFAFLSVLALWLLVRAAAPGGGRLVSVGAGLVLGAGVLLRSSFLVFALAALGWVGWERYRHDPGRARRAAGLVALGLVVAVLPVVALNTARTGRLAFISANGPFNFLIGNLHDASGLPAGTTPTYLAIKASGPPESVDLLAAALADIGRHPVAWLRLQLRKAGLFFGPEEIPNNLSYPMAKKTNPRLRVAFVEYHHLFPLALLGLALAFRRWRRFALLHLFTACYSAATIAFFVPSRLRQPVVLAMILFAGLAVEWWSAVVAERRLRAAVMGLVPVLVVALVLWPGPAVFRATDYAMAAAAHFSVGEELERDLRIDDTWRHYARALALNPDHERAAARVEALDPGRPRAIPPEVLALCEEARLALAAEDRREALRRLEAALELDPEAALPHHYLSNVHYLMGKPRRAMEHLERAVERDPRNRLYRENLKVLRREVAEE